MRLLAPLAAVLVLAGCGSALHGHTTMRTLPRLANRQSSAAQLRAGRQACKNLPHGIAHTRRALRLYLEQHFPNANSGVLLRGCERALRR